MAEISPHHIALAGLLHDIDKFIQLANDKSFANSTAFIQKCVPELFHRPFIHAISHLQKPDDLVSRCLALADKFATNGASQDNQIEALVSVFSRLGTGKQNVRYISSQRLSLEKDVLFPKEAKEHKKTYHDLWVKFVHDVQAISSFQKIDIHIYIEALQSVLQRYLWCVPCGYVNADDISLYDHSRVVAALASCMAHLDDEALRTLEKNNGVVATFIEGDISGIQRFIYSVPMDGATKQLRARSLYLQLLTEVIARYILRRFDMPITNLIYAGGGHFYLLAPAGVDMNALRREIDSILLKHHDGELYLALGATELHPNDFSPKAFGDKWKKLKLDTSSAKSHRYANLPDDGFHAVFKPRPQDRGDELSLRYADRGGADEEGKANAQSKLGRSLEEFGDILKYADAIVLGYTQPQPQPMGGFRAIFAELGFNIDLIYTHKKQTHYPTMKGLDYAIIQGIRDVPDNNTVNDVSRQLECPVLPSLRYTVNVTPMVGEDWRPVTFDKLAEASKGIEYIGVLRMDVDDLGNLFGAGFKKPNGESRASLARVASLSNALSLYFEGWVGEICRDINKKYDPKKEEGAVYAVYSGGDDLFIVGSWDVLPNVAKRIRDDLAEFACQNSDVHISAGIILQNPKYPLYLAADDAEGMLKRAKGLEGKNAICFLGQPVKWSQWDQVIAFKDELINLVTQEAISRSLIWLFSHFYQQYQATVENYKQTNKANQSQLFWGPWMWRSAYQLRRFADRINNEELKQRVLTLSEKLRPNPAEKQTLALNIELMGVAARWAEALTRKKDEEK